MGALQFKEVKIPSVKEKISVREDGKEVLYLGKRVNLYLVKARNHRHGFHQVSIIGKRLYVHKLVAEAFIPNTHPVSKKMILHKDCNTLNNHYKNLEWTDRKGVIENRKRNNMQGFPAMEESYRGTSKISHEEAIKIAARLEKGEYAKDICVEYGVSEMSIARIRKRYVKQVASIRYAPEVKATALQLLKKHKPHELVKITGLKYHTLYRWSKEISNS